MHESARQKREHDKGSRNSSNCNSLKGNYLKGMDYKAILSCS